MKIEDAQEWLKKQLTIPGLQDLMQDLKPNLPTHVPYQDFGRGARGHLNLICRMVPRALTKPLVAVDIGPGTGASLLAFRALGCLAIGEDLPEDFEPDEEIYKHNAGGPSDLRRFLKAYSRLHQFWGFKVGNAGFHKYVDEELEPSWPKKVDLFYAVHSLDSVIRNSRHDTDTAVSKFLDLFCSYSAKEAELLIQHNNDDLKAAIIKAMRSSSRVSEIRSDGHTTLMRKTYD
jgi:hypothetical protein